MFKSFVQKKSVNGSTAGDIALTIAKFTERGGGGINVGEMYTKWLQLRRQRKSSPSEWPEGFMNQSGRNINESINGIAKVLKMLGR